MRLFAFILLLAGLSSSQLCAQTHSKEEILWLSFEQLSDSLAENPKPVLLFIHTDWCAYCKKMLSEGFQDPQVVKKVNADYYAVSLDAETTDTLFFEGQAFTNQVRAKKVGEYHSIAKVFLGKKEKVIFPLTVILDPDFKVITRRSNYLSTKEMLNILKI